MRHLFVLLVIVLSCVSLRAQSTRTHANIKMTETRNAEFPGGTKAMNAWFTKKQKYPPQARAKGITGDIVVAFDVMPDSSTKNVKAMNDLGYGTKEEAERLIRITKFSPAVQNGKRIPQHMFVTVKFRIEKQE